MWARQVVQGHSQSEVEAVWNRPFKFCLILSIADEWKCLPEEMIVLYGVQFVEEIRRSLENHQEIYLSRNNTYFLCVCQFNIFMIFLLASQVQV